MRHYATWTLITALALVVWAAPAAAQPGEDLKSLRKDVDALKQGQSGIKKDLEEIKALLRARPSAPVAAAPAAPPMPKEIALDLNGAAIKGAKTAKIAMVEYSDFQ